MDDSRSRTGVGMFRIFQQSLKEMGSVMEHKRTTKSHKEPDTDENKEVVKENTAEDTSAVNKEVPKTDVTSLVSDTVNSETTAAKQEGTRFPSNSVRSVSGRFSSRNLRPGQRKGFRRPESYSRVSAAALSRSPPYKRQKSPVKKVHVSPPMKYVTKLSAPMKQETGIDNKVNSASEDWSKELIEVTVDSNQNIIDLLSPEPSIDRVGRSEQTFEEVSQRILHVIDERVHQRNIEVNQQTLSIIDEENNNKCDEMNGNIKGCSNQIFMLGNKTEMDSENNESEKVSENPNPTKLQGVVTNAMNGNTFKNQKRIYGAHENHWNLKVDKSKFDVDNVNNNRIIEHGSCKKPSEKYKHTLSEDWSLELDEVDVDLFVLQKNGNFLNPARNSSHEEYTCSLTEGHKHPISDTDDRIDNKHSHHAVPTVQSTETVVQESHIQFEMSKKVDPSHDKTESKANSRASSLVTATKTIPESNKDKLVSKPENENILVPKSEHENIYKDIKDSVVETAVFNQASVSAENESFNIVSEVQVHKKDVLVEDQQEVMKGFGTAIIEVKATEKKDGNVVADSVGGEDINSNSNANLNKESWLDISKGNIGDPYINKTLVKQEGAEKTINKGFSQSAEDNRSETRNLKIKDERGIIEKSQQFTDLEIKTNVIRKGFVEHTQRKVSNKVDTNNISSNQKVERKQYDDRVTQNSRKEKENEDNSCFNRSQYSLRKDQSFGESFSPYNYNDNIIPPRFRKQPYPESVDKTNNKYAYETRTSTVPPFPYRDNRYLYEPYTQEQQRYFSRRNDFNVGRMRTNENRTRNNVIDQKASLDSNRSTFGENKVNIGSEVKECRNLKSPEIATHVPEDWHEEIDKTVELDEKARENIDVGNHRNVLSIADVGNETFKSKENVSNETDYKQEACHKPKPVLLILRVNEVEKPEISVDKNNQLAESDIQTEKVPYLPPSPDELEQASFMSYMTKSKCEVVKSESLADLNEGSTDQKPDDKIGVVENSELTFPLDLQSDQGFDTGNANGQWSAENESELKENFTEKEPQQTGCVVSESCNDSESKEDTVDRVVTGNSETDSRQDARFIVGCENDEENDKLAITDRLDSETNDEIESRQNASDIFVVDNVDENSICEIETQIIKPEKYNVANSNKNVVVNNIDLVAEDNVRSSNDEEEDRGKFKVSPAQTQAERDRQEPSNRMGYPPTDMLQANPMQFYGNQFYQSPWQYYHPSCYYSEQYRRWYEQVYVPQYQRYMQLYSYYDAPLDPYYQSYSTSFRQPHVPDRQMVEANPEQKLQSQRSHSDQVYRQTSKEIQEQNEAKNHKAYSPTNEKSSTAVDSKDKVVETKLSDYWADRMPEWVDKQCKIAKLKNGTQTVDKKVVKSDKSHNKIAENDKHIPCETGTGSKLKTENVKTQIDGQDSKMKLSQLNDIESDYKSRSNQQQSVNHKVELKRSASSCKEVIKKHDTKTEDIAEKVPLSVIKEVDKEAKEVDKDNENYIKEDNSVVDVTTSDSNAVLTGTDSDSFFQPKTGCTCGPDDIQYFLCKMCQCSAGRVPAPEDFVHVYPEERCMDQGYQSFDSIVAEDGTPAVRTRNQPDNHQPRSIYFSLVPHVRHSTPQPHDRRSKLDTQNRSRSECDRSRSECDRSRSELTAGTQERVNKTESSQKPVNTIGKVGPPPGFRTGMHKPEDQKKQDHQLKPSRINMESFKGYTNSERGSSVDINENVIGDTSNSGQRQRRRSGDQLRQQVDSKLKELIEMSKAKTEALKVAKKKNLAEKENVERMGKTQIERDNADVADARIVIKKKEQFLKETDMESDVSQGDSDSYPLRQQIEKMRSKSKLEVLMKQMPAALGDQYRSNLKDSPPHSVESSSGVWKVEKLHPKDFQKTTETVGNSDYVNAKESNGTETRPHEQPHQKTHSHEVVKLAVKEEMSEKQGDGGNEVECSVRLKIPRGRNRSCTVSVSESVADIEVKSSSSGEDKLLDEVKSQSTEEKQSSDIKEHDICEGNLTEQGFYSRKMEGIPCKRGMDMNNNFMAEFQHRHQGFGYPGYRMPYRLQHSASLFDYRTRIPPPSMRSPTNFSERTFTDNRWGSTREENPSKMPPHPWMNTRAPVFRPRNFEETPLYSSPWYMPPPPPPYPPPGTINEGQRKIYRPVYEQIVPNQQYEESSFKSPPPPAATAVGVTGITPDLEKKATWTEKPNTSAKKCLDKKLKKSKLVDYNYSDGEITSDDDIEGFDETSLDSGDIENVRAKQDSVAAVVGETEEIGHTVKRFKVGSPTENVDLSPEAFPDLATAAKTVTPQNSTDFARRPMRKLKQISLKAFPSETVATEQSKFKETLKKNMTLSEVVAAGLKKDAAPNQAGGFATTEASTGLYSAKCQQNMPPYPPPLPPFPASPFWSMFLTNSRSALEGKDPNEDIYAPTNFSIPGPRGILGTWTRPPLSPVMRQDPRLLFSPSETDSENQSKKSDGVRQFKRFHNFGVKYIDTHCHLDFLFNRTNFSGNLKAFIEENPETFPETFEGCVAIFCYPTSFSPTDKILVRLVEEDNVWFAMGCHPKMATEYTEKAEVGLKQCLKHPKCVALGEIGLDYSGTFKQHEEIQKTVFKRQLGFAVKMNKPLVIHCRDAEKDCLEIMKEIVPPKHKIHCHCFTGSYANAKLWMEAFPQLMIGLTPLVTYPSATPSHDLARQIPLDKLLLETDAPYFVPRCRPRLDIEFSNPGFAVTVAKAVAQYQEIPVAMVLRQCRVNTKTMYGI